MHYPPTPQKVTKGKRCFFFNQSFSVVCSQVIIIIVIIIIIIIIIIAFKGAIRDFFTVSLLRHESSLTHTLKWPERSRVQIHVQHIERLSHATCRVTCHVVRKDSSAIKFGRV